MFATNKTGTLTENTNILASQFIKAPANPYKKLNIRPRGERLKGTDQEEIGKIIAALNNKKAPGVDRVTNRLIKIIFERDKEYLTYLFDKILEIGRVPRAWKLGRMVFFRKQGRDPGTPKNYRPITLISGWCKLVERLFIDRIEQDLNEKEFFSPSQFGFRKGVSTVDAIDRLVKIIKKKRKSRKNAVLIVAIDISGAFDSISWTTIVRNLINANCNSAVVGACESLLTERKIQINEKVFCSKKGTPQGGRASPTLFKIGLNSLLKELTKRKIDHVAYADDLALILTGTSQKELQRKLTQAFELIKCWCKEADLAVNEEKTEFLLTTRKRSLDWSLTLNGVEIRTSKSIKYLGVVIDEKLTWADHIKHIDSKIEAMIERVRRFSWTHFDLEWKLKRRLYFSVFLPTIMYASPIWFDEVSRKRTYVEKIKRIQRRFIIAASGAYRCTPSAEIMSLLGVADAMDELRIAERCREISSREKKAFKYNKRSELIASMAKSEIGIRDFRPDEISNKHVIWCITNFGPFKQFLHRIGKSYDDWCRYCNAATESAAHLLFECDAIGRRQVGDLDTSAFNTICTTLVKKLQRDSWIIN